MNTCPIPASPPLHMEHTTFLWDDYLESHKVYGHDEPSNPTRRSPAGDGWDGETFNAYSSLHSEASEYARFVMAMLNREGLDEDTFDEMLDEQTRFTEDNPLRVEGGQTGWGLGFAQKRTPAWTMHLHTGNNHDFQSYAILFRRRSTGWWSSPTAARWCPSWRVSLNSWDRSFRRPFKMKSRMTLTTRGRDPLNHIAVILPWGIGGLFLYASFLTTRVIPRWMSLWGLTAAALTAGATLLYMLEQIPLVSVTYFALNGPTAIFEIILALYLILRGFRSP